MATATVFLVSAICGVWCWHRHRGCHGRLAGVKDKNEGMTAKGPGFLLSESSKSATCRGHERL